MQVAFWLNYQSPDYADRTYKELVIGNDVDGSLRILIRLTDLEVGPARNGRHDIVLEMEYHSTYYADRSVTLRSGPNTVHEVAL